MSKLARFLDIAKYTIGPVLAAVGVPLPIIPFVTHGIEIAENAVNDDGSAKTGAEKKAIALDVVKTGVDALNASKPGTVTPDVVGVVSTGIDTTIGVINLIQSKGQQAGAPQAKP